MQSVVFKLPDLGEGVVEAEIVAWHVRPGEDIRVDQPLVDVMTDKATVTIPSGQVGRVVRTHGNVGDTIAVGAELVSIDTSPQPATAATQATSASLARPDPPRAGPTRAGLFSTTMSTITLRATNHEARTARTARRPRASRWLISTACLRIRKRR